MRLALYLYKSILTIIGFQIENKVIASNQISYTNSLVNLLIINIKYIFKNLNMRILLSF